MKDAAEPTGDGPTGPFRMYLDAEGLPLSDYGGRIGVQRSVLAVAERGLLGSGALSSYVWEGIAEPDAAATARSVRWLMETLRDEPEMAIWRYPYPSYYGTHAGWASAHAQAVALRLLTDEGAAVPLDKALRAFVVPVPDGGFALGDWYEKFADPAITPPQVLNGMLFTLVSLHAIDETIGSPEARRLFGRGLGAVIPMLPRYDLGGWSAHDIHGRRASAKYHGLHVRLLDHLHVITGHDELARWRDRWGARARRREARMAQRDAPAC